MIKEDKMSRGEKYDQMVSNPADDPLKCFEKYAENMKYLQDRIISYKPKRIFDLGCGTGNLTGGLSQTFQVIGIDQSEDMLEQLKKKHPNVEPVKKDGLKWLEESAFRKGDLIATSFLLHGIKDKDRIFKAFFKALRSGAVITIIDYAFENASKQDQFIENLERENHLDLVDFINRKNYLHIDAVKRLCTEEGVCLTIHKHTHWIYSFEIR